ncbi:MAG: hypothetical protein MR598_01385 [Erysipelotrichaceae bacterium]|nr:hypothetical protein [Erysipelotrichaceae bacterium]
MKFRNRGNYFIPHMENKNIHGVDQCYINHNVAILTYILECTSKSIFELMQQYSAVMDEEEIRRLMAIQKETARSLGCNPKFCYQYFGNEASIYQGVSFEMSDEDSVFIRFTQNDCIQNPSYQRRIELEYDLDTECYMVHSLVELEKRNGIVIEKKFNPRVLRKVKKYIQY